MGCPEAGFCPEADRAVPFFPDELFLRVDFLPVDFLPVDFLRVVPVDALVGEPAG